MESPVAKINRLQAKNCPARHHSSHSKAYFCSHQLTKPTLYHALQSYWENIGNHYFPNKENTELLLNQLCNSFKDKQNVTVQNIDISKLIRIFQKSTLDTLRFANLDALKCFYQTVQPSYLQSISRKDIDILLKHICIAHQSLDRKPGHIINKVTRQSLQFDPIRSYSKEKYLGAIVDRLESNKKRKGDNVSQQLKTINKQLEKTSLRNDRRLSNLQKCVSKMKILETTTYRASIVSFCQILIQQMKIKQQIESVSYTQGPYKIGRGKFYDIHFQKALKLAPKRIPANKLQQIDKLRQISLFKYYILPFKSLYSVMSFSKQSNSKIFQRPYQKIDKQILPGDQKYSSNRIQEFAFCHQCKYMVPISCLNFCGFNAKKGKKGCGRSYCLNCIKIFYKQVDKDCPYCQQYCCCSRCQRQDIKSRMKQIITNIHKVEQINQSQTDDHQTKRQRRNVKSTKKIDIGPSLRKIKSKKKKI